MTCRNCNGPLPPATGTRERVWCSDRCRKAAGRRAPSNGMSRPLEPLPEGATVTDALDAFLASVDYPPEDPRAVVASVARLLAQDLDRHPSANIARELRSHVEHLGAGPNEDPGIIDEIRARRAQRRVEMLLDPALADDPHGARRNGHGG